MKFDDDQKFFGKKQNKKNTRIQEIHENRLGNIKRKLSRGAANIFRMIRTRSKWGNKNLWGKHDHGRPKGPTDKSSGN